MFRFWAVGALLLCIICNSDAGRCSSPNHCVAGGTCKNKVGGVCFFNEECCAPGIGGPQATQNGLNQQHGQFSQPRFQNELLEVPQSQQSVPRNPNPEPPGFLDSNPVHQFQQNVPKNPNQEPPKYAIPEDPTFPPGQQYPQPVLYKPPKLVSPELPKFATSETPQIPNPEPPMNPDAKRCNSPNHCVAGGTCKNKVRGNCLFSEECCAPGIGGPQATQNGLNQQHAGFPQPRFQNELLEVPQNQPSVPRNPNPEPQEHANPIKANFSLGSLDSNPVHQFQQNVPKNPNQEPPKYAIPEDPTFPPGQQYPQPVLYKPPKLVSPELPKFTNSETPKFPNPEPPMNPIPDVGRYQPNPAPPSHQPKPAPAPKEPYDENCGWSNRNAIIASEPVRHLYPWTIALFYHGNYFASGSLVSPGVVVTAAHLINSTNIVARAGDYDFLLRVEQFPPDERHVARVQTHDNYQPQNGANNIALLFLESPFTLRPHIRTICLPQHYKSFDSKRCVIAGWSKFSDMKFQDSDVQTQRQLTVARIDCKNIFGENYQRAEGLICTTGVRDDNACTVDSGSPLFCPLEDQPHRYELAGISSRNYECGQERVDSLFTDVAELSGWIKEQVQQGVEGNPGKITPKMG